MTDVTKATSWVIASDELVADSQSVSSAFADWLSLSDEEHAARAVVAEHARAPERAQAGEPVPLTLDRLLATLGFSVTYAEHLVQPYCNCGDSADGWDRCAHARDLGLS